MTIHFPIIGESLAGHNGLFSSVPAVRRQQISRFNAYMKGNRFDAKKTRALRKAEYKKLLAKQALPAVVSQQFKENPMQYGLPRSFRVLVAGDEVMSEAKLHDLTRYKDEGHTLYFSAFGVAGKPVRLNNTWIHPDGKELSPDKRVYTLFAGDKSSDHVSLYLDFTMINAPTGYIETQQGQHALKLDPSAVSFNVKVSTGAGARKSTGKRTLVWDVTSPEWVNAKWEENAMVFSYDTKYVANPFGTYALINEVSFKDPQAQGQDFEMTADKYGIDYTSVMEDSDQPGNGAVMVTSISADIPGPPVSRAHDTILSVFPDQSIFQFDEFGSSFTGAYTIPNSDQVFAVTGEGMLPSVVAPVNPSSEADHTSTTSGSAGATVKSALFQSAVKPIPSVFKSTNVNASNPMPIIGLINCDTMAPDDKSSTGYSDFISALSNKDFHDIICYWMDDDIHKTFISGSPTVLDSDIQAIATDSVENAQFYKTMQTPYVISSLSRSSLDESSQCNGVRADGMLKDLPANSPVYQRHSDALYRYRFLTHFTGVKNYLADQITNATDYKPNMQAGADAMKAQITNLAQGVNAPDKVAAKKNLDAALAEIDALHEWAVENNLFYAFNLYYWCSTFFLPQLYALSSNGALSASVARSLKKLTCIFGVLEDQKQNPNGESFAQGFNNLVQFFQMQAIIPQFVDADGNSQDIDSIMKESLDQFYQDNIGSADPTVVQEAQRAEQLSSDDNLRASFFKSLSVSMRLAGSLGNWIAVVKQFDQLNGASSWFKNLVGAADMASTFLRGACIALLILPMIPSLGGGWSGMSTTQRVAWVATAAGIGLTLFIKGVQGVLRLTNFWEDLGGFGMKAFKAFWGSEKVIADLPTAAEATENTFARWFLRTGAQNMELAGDEITVGMKIFGRSAGEFLTNCVGAVLAGVNLALTAVDLSKTSDPLQKTMDGFLLASSGFQLLGVAANWLTTALSDGALIGEEWVVELLGECAAACGPLAVVFAVVGIAIMIAMIFLSKPPNPVQNFLDNQGSQAGLKMDHDTAIDYFNVVPADASSTSLNGISFQATANGASGYLKFVAPTASNPTNSNIAVANAVTYLPDTCWCVTTDSNGLTRIYTEYIDAKGLKQTRCLTEMDDGSVGTSPQPSKTTTDASGKIVPVDPTTYAAELAKQQWSFSSQSDATKTQRTYGKDTIPFTITVSFSIKRGNNTLYFVQGAGGALGLELSASEPASSSSTWTLNLETMGPSTFSYNQEKWELTTASSDERNGVNFLGTTSLPLTWSVTPAFPSFLQFADPNADEGSIVQVSGASVPVMDPVEYTITASILINGQNFSKTANVTVSVISATPSPTLLSNLKISGESSEHTSSASASSAKLEMNRAIAGSLPGHSSSSAGSGMSSTSDGVDEETKENYDKLMATAPPLFGWSPVSAVPMNEHWTAQSAIARMQNSLSGSWGTGQSFQDLYFPNPPAAPPLGSSDKIMYPVWASCLVTQAIYNGDSDVQGDCDLSKANLFAAIMGGQFWAALSDRFVDWLQWSGSDKVTGGLCTLDQYRSIITNKYWIAMRRGESGLTPPTAMEMYHHFLKLTALGATQADISAIYSTLTVSVNGSPVLDPLVFQPITDQSWSSYRGFVSNAPITYDQLGVQNLNSTDSEGFSGGGAAGHTTISTDRADWDFLSSCGDLIPHHSGCCFSAGTHVLLADGKTTAAIESLQPGAEVLSPTKGDDAGSRVVHFVSTPARAGRSLYALKDFPDVQFTATHPILQGYDSDNLPILGFVDVNTALKINPLWGAFRLQTIATSQLVQYAPKDAGELLYDLILDHNASSGTGPEVATFVILTANGQKLTVCSEAPDVSTIPSMTKFILAFASEIGKANNAKKFFPEGLREADIDYNAVIQKYRGQCADAVNHVNATAEFTTTLPKKIDMAFAVSVLAQAGQGSVTPQNLADASEIITSILGLGLQSHLEDGWQYEALPTTQNAGDEEIEFLATHFLQLLQPELAGVPESSALQYSSLVDELAKLIGDKTVDVSASVTRISASTGSGTPQSIARQSLGPHLHRLQSCILVGDGKLQSNGVASTGPSNKIPVSYKLSINVGSHLTLFARGTVVPDIEARWPVYAASTGASTPNPLNDMIDVAQFWHVGWISLTKGKLPSSALSRAADWETISPSTGTSKMEAYAEFLGKKVGADIVASVV